MTFFVTLRLSQAAIAENIELFDSTLVKPRYTVEMVIGGFDNLIVNGDVVIMGETLELDPGETFIFKRVLGAGLHTIVIEDFEGRAIRLPRILEEPIDRVGGNFQTTAEEQMTQHNLWFHQAYTRLSSRVEAKYLARIDYDSFQSDWVTTAELLSIRFLLSDFLGQDFDPESEVFEELIEFMEAFRHVRSLGPEFLPFQIGYVQGRGWVLFDYDLNLKLGDPDFAHRRLSTHFNHWSELVDRYELELDLDNLMIVEDALQERDQAYAQSLLQLEQTCSGQMDVTGWIKRLLRR